MNDNTPLQSIEAFESTAFRLTQLGRRLRLRYRKHIRSMSFGARSDGHVSLIFTVRDLAKGTSIAEDLGLTMIVTPEPSTSTPGGSLNGWAEGDVEGIEVNICAVRLVYTDEEWQEGLQAAEGGAE